MSYKIFAIIYSEFNLEKGPEIVYQVPHNYIKQEDFKKISEFVVPTTQFCNKEVSLHLGNTYLLGYPISLNNPIYDRNRFEFNFAILIDEEEYENNNYLYDCLIKKICTTFENLEIDYDFNFMKKNVYMIQKFIETLYSHFNSNQSVINIHIEEGDNENEININEDIEVSNDEDNSKLNNIGLEKLKPEDLTFSKSKTEMPRISPKKEIDLSMKNMNNSSKDIIKPEYINNYDNNSKNIKTKKQINFSFRYIDFAHIKINIKNYYVPIWIKELDKEEIKKLDNIKLYIINKINGINSVNKISKILSIGIDLVKYALSSLYIIGGIAFIDIFQYTNIYKPTIELKKLKIEGFLQRFKKFCKMNKDENKFNISYENQNEKNNNDEYIFKYMDDNKLFSYYVLLTNSKDVKHFADKLNNYEFNLQLFVGFGVYLGIIRRIHLYYYFIGKEAINNEILSLMDGNHCEDEILVEKGVTLETLRKYYDDYKHLENKCYYLYK